MNICDIESAPTYPVVQSMNFDQDMVKRTLISLNWAMVQEDYTPGTVSSQSHALTGSPICPRSSTPNRSAVRRTALGQTNVSAK